MVINQTEAKNKISMLIDAAQALVRAYSQPVLAMNQNGDILDCNNHFLNVYEVSKSAVLSKNYFTSLNEIGIAPLGCSLKSLLSNKTDKITFHRVDEKRFIKYLQWTLFNFSLIGDNDIYILLAHDVTPILEVATKEQLLIDSLIDSVPAEIFWKDKSLVYLGCNKSFVNSLDLKDKSEVIGKTDFDLPVDREDSDLYRDDDLRIIHTKKSQLNIIERQFLNDAKERVLNTSKVPLFDDQGEVYGILGVCRDITEQKKSEDQLKKAIKMAEQANYTKSEFIANMSHDIRTPLSGVVGISQLLVDTLSNSEHSQQAQWIHECGVQLLSLLNDILTVIASDDDEKNGIKEEVFNLRQCIDDLVHLERPSTEMKGIDLNVDIDSDTPELLFGDRSSLYRILLNLLGNAIKFTSIGNVSLDVRVIEMSEEKVRLHFMVNDTGIGIPKDLQGKVFDRFYRANPSYKGVYSGHGIGLHIANTYVKRMGGDLQFTSDVGVGTSFFFDLDFKITESKNLTADVPEIDESTKKDLSFATPINKDLPIVLLVEDNYVALKVLESITKLVNMRFVSANDGESALEIATRQHFNLIITDIGLPGISGKELTSKIRAWEKIQNRQPVPIIGLTAHVRAQVREKCIESGMNDAYSKPIDLKTMNEIIKRFVC